MQIPKSGLVVDSNKSSLKIQLETIKDITCGPEIQCFRSFLSNDGVLEILYVAQLDVQIRG